MSNAIDKLIKSLAAQGIQASRLSDDTSPCVVHDYLGTGCVVLDAIMGGGLPVGRMTEIFGDTSTGKSLIAAQACTAVQDIGGLAVYFDTEAAVSLPIMMQVGVDVDNLLYSAPDTVEQVFSGMEHLISGNDPDRPMLIVWDSVAATSSAAEMKGDMGDVGYLTHARVISQALRKLTRQIAKKRVACLFLNQAKEKIGVMFGDKTATFGGKAIGFHASIRIHLHASKIKSSGRVVGIWAKSRVVKNKVAPPFREAKLPIYFGYGIDEDEAIVEYLKEYGDVVYGGGWYTIPLPSGDIKFRKNEFGAAVLDDHYDEVCDMVYAVSEDQDL